ncbi:MAG TPA: hypothetical protein VJU15_09565 [Gemmatimonadales bacterium]|nr:hypothetical protein [Gemmatimonadales bacterium]
MSYRSVVVAGLVPLVAATLVAQSLPRSQPAIINIYREVEKPNHAVAHEVTEERWADFNRRSGYPTSYFGLVAASGVPEVWWISRFENMEGFGKSLSFEARPGYNQGLARIQTEDAEHVVSFTSMQARAMREASHGLFPDLSKQRVYSIMTVRIKPGYESAFGEIAGHYKMAAGTSEVAGWRVYEVIAGAPNGTYLILTSFSSWGAVDANDAEWGKVMGSAGPHMDAAGKLAKEAIESTEVRYFTINPRISMVPKEIVAADAFWDPKAAPAPVRKPLP